VFEKIERCGANRAEVVAFYLTGIAPTRMMQYRIICKILSMWMLHEIEMLDEMIQCHRYIENTISVGYDLP